MEKLDLKRVWKITQIMSKKEEKEEFYFDLLGYSTNINFDSFITYFSFRFIENEEGEIYKLLVFNDDRVPYEDFTVGNFINIPIELLSMSNYELNTWADNRIEQLKKDVINDKENERMYLENQIKQLQDRLEKL